MKEKLLLATREKENEVISIDLKEKSKFIFIKMKFRIMRFRIED